MNMDLLQTGVRPNGVTDYELLVMVDGTKTVDQLRSASGLSRSTLQYKLRKLLEAALIEANKNGRTTVYRRTPHGDEALATSGYTLTDLPSPRTGWKRKDRRQRKFRNDDGSLSYGKARNTFNPEMDDLNPKDVFNPPISSSSNSLSSLEGRYQEDREKTLDTSQEVEHVLSEDIGQITLEEPPSSELLEGPETLAASGLGKSSHTPPEGHQEPERYLALVESLEKAEAERVRRDAALAKYSASRNNSRSATLT